MKAKEQLVPLHSLTGTEMVSPAKAAQAKAEFERVLRDGKEGRDWVRSR